jgi:hypothetical protein
MKKMLLFALTTCLLFLTNCNNNKTESFKHSPNDTLKTVAVYMMGNEGELRYGYTYKVLCDTMTMVKKDSNSMELKWGRDSLYYIPLVDTIRDKFNKPVKDSIGNYNYSVTWVNIERSNIIHDYNKNIKANRL